jgi:hypothetical protein
MIIMSKPKPRPGEKGRRPQAPNDQITDSARQFREATLQLSRGKPKQVLPLYMVGTLALELYLKSLLGVRVYSELPPDLGAAQDISVITALSSVSGHDLVDLYDGLPDDLRKPLDRKYEERPVIHNAPTLRDALAPFRKTFLHSRYIFEAGADLPYGHSLDGFVSLVCLLGEFVEGLPRGWLS